MEMAKTNGWAVLPSPSTSSVPTDSKYTRYTELRRVDDNDIFKLATILDGHNFWQKLMGIIPKQINARECSSGEINFKEFAAKVGYKYTVHQMSLLSAERLNPGQSISQIMIDEWKTSGKFNERPTVGVLLHMLIQAEIYSAADHVAIYFLNEDLPARPSVGPAAIIDFDSVSIDTSEEMEVDESDLSPGNAQVRTSKMNMDNWEKHVVQRDKSMPHPIENGASKPVPPPRTGRSARLSKATTSNATPSTVNSASTKLNIPNLSFLNASDKLSPSNEQIQQPHNIPNLSILNGSSDMLSTDGTSNTTLDSERSNSSSNTALKSTATLPNLPLLTLLIDSSTCEISSTSDASTSATATTSISIATEDMNSIAYNSLPAISALNLNTGSTVIEATSNGVDDNSSGTNSLSNNDEDDDDDDDDVDVDDEEADVSLPNLSNSDHQTSNNDSSLTTVTGTSGENSFELTHDSSSASNDDYTNNIPNLSELQQ